MPLHALCDVGGIGRGAETWIFASCIVSIFEGFSSSGLGIQVLVALS